MAPVFEDPLKKREQFAVSLRKQKSKAVVKQKRMKLLSTLEMQRMQEQNGGSRVPSSSMQVCLDRSNAEYFGYYKFDEDPELFKKLVNEISPTFFAQPNTKQKVKVALKSLARDQEGSTIHQLALMAAIRMSLTDDDFNLQVE